MLVIPSGRGACEHFTRARATVNIFTEYKMNFDVNHMVNDNEKCKILKCKINRDIDTMDYLVKPNVRRLINKVENIKIITNPTRPHADYNAKESICFIHCLELTVFKGIAN